MQLSHLLKPFRAPPPPAPPPPLVASVPIYTCLLAFSLYVLLFLFLCYQLPDFTSKYSGGKTPFIRRLGYIFHAFWLGDWTLTAVGSDDVRIIKRATTAATSEDWQCDVRSHEPLGSRDAKETEDAAKEPDQTVAVHTGWSPPSYVHQEEAEEDGCISFAPLGQLHQVPESLAKPVEQSAVARALKAREWVLAQINAAINHRAKHAGAAPDHDILPLLLEAVDPETGGRLTKAQIRKQVIVLLTAQGSSPDSLAFVNNQVKPPLVVLGEQETMLGQKLYVDAVAKEILKLAPIVIRAARRGVSQNVPWGLKLTCPMEMTDSPSGLHNKLHKAEISITDCTKTREDKEADDAHSAAREWAALQNRSKMVMLFAGVSMSPSTSLHSPGRLFLTKKILT